jgi:hypothetical protein
MTTQTLTPINAFTKRAYTGKQNIATLLNSNFSEQQRLTASQVKMIGCDLKPGEQPYPIVWLDKSVKQDEDGKLLVNMRVLNHEVYNIAQIRSFRPELLKKAHLQRAWNLKAPKPMTEKQYQFISRLLRKLNPKTTMVKHTEELKKIEGISAQEAGEIIKRMLAAEATTPH